MGPTTRKGKEVLQSEIVLNSLLYFVQIAMVGNCHQDPKLSEIEKQQNLTWIINAISEYIYDEEDNRVIHDGEVEAAFELLFDESKPWFSPTLKPLTKLDVKSYHNLLTSIIKGVANIAKRKCAVRFATMDRNFPSFEVKKPIIIHDQISQTDPYTCTTQDRISQTDPSKDIPEDRLITGKDFNLIMNEIRSLKAQVMSRNSQKKIPSTSYTSLPDPITEAVAVPTRMSGEGLWTQVVKKGRKKLPSKATIGSSESSYLAASKARPASIFITRLAASTSEEHVKKHLEDFSLVPTQIEKLKTKFETYSSYRVVIELGNKALKDVLESKQWPKHVLVRKFYETKTPQP